MHHDEPVSETHQMYLKALYRLSAGGAGARVRDLARDLGLTPGTVSAGVNRLHELGLVERERYGTIVLTSSGEAIARCVIRRYETVRALLVDVLGIDAESAARDACRMEHAVGPLTVNRIATLVTHVRSGKALDRDTLPRLFRGVRSGCADCEAAGVCQAAAREPR